MQSRNHEKIPECKSITSSSTLESEKNDYNDFYIPTQFTKDRNATFLITSMNEESKSYKWNDQQLPPLKVFCMRVDQNYK